MVRRWAPAVVFVILAYVGVGGFGLAAAVAIAAASEVLGVPRRAIWAASVAAMAAAPLALIAQGLPQGPVVGAAFASDHHVSHLLVAASLLLAAWAGLKELAEVLADRSPDPAGSARQP